MVLRGETEILIGHTLYPTVVEEGKPGPQPIRVGDYVLVHNGQIPNYKEIKKELESEGIKIKSSASDSEIFMHAILNNSGNNLREKILNTVKKIKLAYSCIIVDSKEEKMYAFRDRYGIRPLFKAEVENEDKSSGVIFSSENGFLDDVIPNGSTIKKINEVSRGSLVEVDKFGKTKEYSFMDYSEEFFCSLEIFYFLRHKNVLFSETGEQVTEVKDVRMEVGRQLYTESKTYFDSLKNPVVIPLLNSGKYFALGFSEESEIIYEELIQIRDDYTGGRSFIEGRDDRVRHIERKFKILYEQLNGKDLIIFDDSVIRGNTTKSLIKLIREHCNPNSINVVSAYPKVVDECNLGIDLDKTDLIGSKNGEEVPDSQISNIIGATKIIYGTHKILENVQEMLQKKICGKCVYFRNPEIALLPYTA